jgi:hypothetical protein
MERQYYAQRFRTLPNGRNAGTIPVGEIVYVQDGVRPFAFPQQTICREPWKVEAWIPRETLSVDKATGKAQTKRCAGGHLAQVRSLRDSRQTRLVADWILLACIDAGLCR